MSGRRFWTDAADVLLEGALPHRSADGALYALPGPRPSDNGPGVDAFEGFARSLLLAAFRCAHSEAARRDELLDRYAAGLRTGPLGAWPRIDGLTQPLVEAAAIATALLVEPAFLARLSATERGRLFGYFRVAQQSSRPAGNWMWFRVMIETFLDQYDEGGDLETVDRYLDEILRLRRRDGMWTDGGGARYDYYSSWAFSFYSALWSRIDGSRSPEVSRILADQAAELQTTLFSLFDDEGRPVLLGRSLIYRTAAVAGLWSPLLLGRRDPASDARVAVVSSRALQRVMESPAIREGVLTLGWTDEFLPLVQPYSGPASPLWMSKAFVCLLLPEGDPVWTADTTADGAERLPVREARRVVADPGWLVQRSGPGVRVHNHGTWRSDEERDPHSRRYLDDPLYSRLAYSSVTGPVIDEALLTSNEEPVLPDNAVVIDDDRGRATVRREVEPIVVDERWAVSRWTPASATNAWPTVISATVPVRDAEVRVHRITLERAARVTLTGYALSGSSPVAEFAQDGWAVAQNDALVSAIAASTRGVARVEAGVPGVFGPRTALPAIEVILPAGTHDLMSAVLLVGAGEIPEVPSAEVVDGMLRVVIDGEPWQTAWPPAVSSG